MSQVSTSMDRTKSYGFPSVVRPSVLPQPILEASKYFLVPTLPKSHNEAYKVLGAATGVIIS